STVARQSRRLQLSRGATLAFHSIAPSAPVAVRPTAAVNDVPRSRVPSAILVRPLDLQFRRSVQSQASPESASRRFVPATCEPAPAGLLQSLPRVPQAPPPS